VFHVKRFITGTDTGVGKTAVTVALADIARGKGLSVFAFKPVETGGVEDQQRLGNGLYTFKQPRAPWVAAQLDGTEIDLDLIISTVSRETATVVLVEGAGGWRVPITASADMAELARRLGYPVVVVARAGLGTINHSLLTLEAVERDGLNVAALILSQLPTDDPAFTRSNREQIAHRWPGRILVFDGGTASLDEIFSDS
jgi:dethiobiotin synthetase